MGDRRPILRRARSIDHGPQGATNSGAEPATCTDPYLICGVEVTPGVDAACDRGGISASAEGSPQQYTMNHALISNPDMINPGQIIEMPQPPKSAALRYFVLSRPSSGKVPRRRLMPLSIRFWCG